MKQSALILLTGLVSFFTNAQDITGQWNGLLKIQGTQLRLVFNISKTEKGLISTLDSPDQGAKGIPATNTTFNDSILKIAVAGAGIEYEGTLGKDNIIVGNFKQGGQSLPINLSKKKIEKEKPSRPQEPAPPYTYHTEEVIFQNQKAGITLAGTLTLPTKNGIFPVVVLISGSGPQNRDEEIVDHRPFLVIADYLTKNGIAVLRYDDRGTAKSTGNFATATSVDLSTDVEAGIQYLKSRKEINKLKIGLVGHSEGGLIAPIVASKSKDIAFIVLLAGTGIRGDQLLLEQQRLIAKASGSTEEQLKKMEMSNRKAFDLINTSKNTKQLKIDLTSYIKQTLIDNPTEEKPQGMSDDDFVKLQVEQITTPWMLYFLMYDPAPTLEKVKCPVLALNGERDLQVHPKENLEAIKNALIKGGNLNVTTHELPGLNHLFQECQTGSPEEYAAITQTFSPKALIELLDWVKIQTK